MRIGTTSIVTNEYNEVLLILRDDTRTWAAPGGSLDLGELPTDCAAREVKEETGMYTLPVRLVAADFWPTSSATLHLTFRSLIRGGEPTPSAEALQVGFFNYHHLPRPMLSVHKDQLLATRDHVGPALWQSCRIPWRLFPIRLALMLFVYPFKDLRSRWRREPRYQPPPSWEVEVVVAVVDKNGLFVVDKSGQLPHGRCPSTQAPWDFAKTFLADDGVSFSQIGGIYVVPDSTKMSIVFTNPAAYTADIPPTLLPEQQALLQDLGLDPDNTRFAYRPKNEL